MPYGEIELGGDAKYTVSFNYDFGSSVETINVTWTPDVSSGISELERDAFFQTLIDFVNTFPGKTSINASKIGLYYLSRQPTE